MSAAASPSPAAETAPRPAAPNRPVIDRTPPYRLNTMLTGGALLIAVLWAWVLPLLLPVERPWVAALVLLLAALATPLHQALLHEAIHDRLLRGRDINRIGGRALSAVNFVTFDAVRFGHLQHHAFNRHPLDQPDVLREGEGWRGWLAFYGHLFGGLWAVSFASSLGLLLPSRIGREIVAKAMEGEGHPLPTLRRRTLALQDDTKVKLRAAGDMAAGLVLYGGAIWAWGSAWGWVLGILAVRALVISALDNVAHYGTPIILNAPAINLRLKRPFSYLYLNQNCHALHHEQPSLPWTVLPDVLEGRAERPRVGFGWAMIRQFLAPVRAPAMPAAGAEPVVTPPQAG